MKKEKNDMEGQNSGVKMIASGSNQNAIGFGK